MKSRAFHVVFCLALHLMSEGVPMSIIELIAAVLVARRAWEETAPPERAARDR